MSVTLSVFVGEAPKRHRAAPQRFLRSASGSYSQHPILSCVETVQTRRAPQKTLRLRLCGASAPRYGQRLTGYKNMSILSKFQGVLC